ncbi:MAG: DUF2090 domain-containing protein [Planctomycetota bacterium]|nr:DUF2090 domain-containing protein [Planctomycetota bacterium]
MNVTANFDLGYDKPLYILPFDHRHSYGAEVFGYHEPMTTAQIADVAASKQVIYEGFKLALTKGVPVADAGILVDEEFGTEILRDAAEHHYIFAMSCEKSGQHEFDLQYGDEFALHIAEFNPTFVKVLVRCNPEGDQEMNARQTERLKRLSDYLHSDRRRLMFELLVPPEPDQLASVGGDAHRFDLELRPNLVIQVIEQMQAAGVEPDIWKIEGLDLRSDCERVVAAVRQGGRDKVCCIVLGRGENEAKVIEWLQTAATVPGFTGFAVGRSTFLQPIVQLRQGTITRETAIQQIADRYLEWVRLFEQARTASAT